MHYAEGIQILAAAETELGLPPAGLAQVIGVHPETMRRWKVTAEPKGRAAEIALLGIDFLREQGLLGEWAGSDACQNPARMSAAELADTLDAMRLRQCQLADLMRVGEAVVGRWVRGDLRMSLLSSRTVRMLRFVHEHGLLWGWWMLIKARYGIKERRPPGRPMIIDVQRIERGEAA